MPDARQSRFATLFSAARATPLRDLLAQKDRARQFSFEAGPLSADFAMTHLSRAMLAAAPALARSIGWKPALAAMLAGEPINSSEGRPVLHLALRMSSADRRAHLPADLADEYDEADVRLESFVQRFAAGKIRTASGDAFTGILHIGIGGGALGPQLILDAFDEQAATIPVRLCANVDPVALARATKGLDPARTLVIYCSKSWTTRESRFNLDRALAWVATGGVADPRRHVVAVTSKPGAARDWGASEDFILPQPESVGGRYSVLSSVGVAIALRYGWKLFAQLRAGAAMMDEIAINTPADRNPALLAAFTGWGYASLWKARSRAIFAYHEPLRLLVPYVQQLELESLGKGVTLEGKAVRGPATPVLWGGTGTSEQHSVFQMLHQAGEWVPLDFILFREGPLADGDSRQAHRVLYANGLAQASSLATGQSLAEAKAQLVASGMSAAAARELAPHKVFPGNRPSLLLEAERLTPQVLGALISFYEHRTFAQGLLWGLNPYDQMGVELGKVQALAVEAALDAATQASLAPLDPVTRSRVEG